MNNYTIRELFEQQIETNVAIIQQNLSQLKIDPSNLNLLEPIIQASHVIWGATRLVEMEITANLSQSIKDCCVAAQKKTITLQENHLDLLLNSGDLILTMSKISPKELGKWLEANQENLNQIQTNLTRILNGDNLIIEETSPISQPEPEIISNNSPEQSEPEIIKETQPIIIEETPKITEVKPEKPPEIIEVKVPEDNSMMELFRLEAEAQVTILNNGLLVIENHPQSAQDLEALMRAAHSIKGAARIVNLNLVVSLAHIMEDVFVAAQNKALILTPEDVDILLSGVDLLQNISQMTTNQLSEWLGENQANFSNIQSQIAAILNPELKKNQHQQTEIIPPQPTDSNLPAPSPSSELIVQESPAKITKNEPITENIVTQDRVVRVSADNLNRIMGLAGESLIEANWLQPFADSMMLLKSRLVEISQMMEQLEESLEQKQQQSEEKIHLIQTKHQHQESVEFLSDRLDELELYVRRTASLSDRLYREVINSHMRPFADGVQGFPRMIRDLARKLNKQVKLEIIGKSTPVDRDILKKLEAPLTHILRNAVDHGLELPEERIASGKPAEGTIRLEAFHRGGMLAINIADDGKGIDREKLKQKIIQKNLASAEMVEKFSEVELMEFLFLPGFSTAKEVTEISGRGVGLDIAKSMAQEVRGTVRAVSHAGKGTSFHFQLPLTLSVVRTLLVEISGKPYAIPLARIDKIVTLEQTEITDVENRQYFSMDGQNIGLIAAYQILELPETIQHEKNLSVVVVSDQTNIYGLVVDKFLEERDLVVRPLDPRLGKVPDISATALLSDGSAILILDVSDIIRSMDTILKGGRLNKVNIESETELLEKRKRVLVVDDSITVREMERQLLENEGYYVDTAVNGVEGWNAVRTNHYDLVISDIDMPRMNGIELVKQIRHNPRLSAIPVIIISYRDREEDRLQGLEAGADYYLTKSSFQDDTLINAVIDLIGK